MLFELSAREGRYGIRLGKHVDKRLRKALQQDLKEWLHDMAEGARRVDRRNEPANLPQMRALSAARLRQLSRVIAMECGCPRPGGYRASTRRTITRDSSGPPTRDQ